MDSLFEKDLNAPASIKDRHDRKGHTGQFVPRRLRYVIVAKSSPKTWGFFNAESATAFRFFGYATEFRTIALAKACLDTFATKKNPAFIFEAHRFESLCVFDCFREQERFDKYDMILPPSFVPSQAFGLVDPDKEIWNDPGENVA